MEPPQHDKFLLIQNILKESDQRFPAARFNGVKCKYTLISMNNTRVIERDGRFGKDKKSESAHSGVQQLSLQVKLYIHTHQAKIIQDIFKIQHERKNRII